MSERALICGATFEDAGDSSGRPGGLPANDEALRIACSHPVQASPNLALRTRRARASPQSICYINGKFASQHITGVQRTALGLLQELDRHLATMPPDDARARWVLVCPRGAKVPELAHIEVRHVGLSRIPLSLWEQFRLPWAARGGRLFNLAGSAPALARQQVCMMHDAAVFDRPQAYTPLFRIWYRLLFSWLARTEASLLTVSAYSKSRLEFRLSLQPGRLHVVPNGGDHLTRVDADPGALERFGVLPGGYVLAVGNDNPNKNLAMLEARVQALHARIGLRLVVVGGLNRRVFSAAREEEAVDNDVVRRLGPINDSELKALYQGALGLVFPSLYEGFGLPPLEAMSCGCPVIAARSGAIPDVCGPAAAYFQPDRHDELDALLMRLATDPAWRDVLRAAGEQRFRHFTWRESVSLMLRHLGQHDVLGHVTEAPAAAEGGLSAPAPTLGISRWSLPPSDQP